MRILHVYKDYDPVPGGIEGTVGRLARGQAARGHDVTVLATAPAGTSPGERVESGVRVVRGRRLATLASMPVSFALVGALRRERPDVTHLHFPYPWGEWAHSAFGRSGATVVGYHSDVVRQRVLGRLVRPLALHLLRSADAVCPTSPPYVETSVLLRRVRDRCTVVPLGIDADRFGAVAETALAAAKERIGPGAFLFHGCLRAYKGLATLVRAVELCEGVRLAISGIGREEADLRRRVAASSAAGRIRILGRTSDEELPALLAASRALVLPSTVRSEAFGIVLLEAMASRVPVISTALGTGTDWVNRDGETGLVVAAGDAVALAAAFERLSRDSELCDRLGRAGRARVEAEFTSSRMVERTLAVYDEARRRCARRAGRDVRGRQSLQGGESQEAGGGGSGDDPEA